MRRLLLLTTTMLIALTAMAQEKPITNRYAMKMTQNADGTYSLQQAKKYARIMDVTTIPDVFTPYTHVNDRLTSKLYKGVRSEDIVYKKHDGYELILTVDFAETAEPAPFMIYVHGASGCCWPGPSASSPRSSYWTSPRPSWTSGTNCSC